jgi:hypothetical protein
MAIHLKTLGLKFAKYREQLCETVEATGARLEAFPSG